MLRLESGAVEGILQAQIFTYLTQFHIQYIQLSGNDETGDVRVARSDNKVDRSNQNSYN